MITVAAALAATHAKFKNEIAIRSVAGGTKTYEHLGMEARQVVAALGRRGVAKGDRVIVLSQNRDECFVVDHALAIGGFVRVALSYRLHPKEVVEIAQDCRASAVFVDGVRTAEIFEELQRSSFDGLVIGFDGGEAVIPYSDLLEEEPVVVLPDVSPDDPAWMPYTSGTTGVPKGVVHTHRSIMSLMAHILIEMPAGGPSDVLLHIAPLTHLSGYAMLAYFLRGASHIAVPKFDPVETLRVVQQYKVTVLPAVPTMINLMLSHLEEKRYDVSSIHTILYGGSPIAPDRLARALRCLGPVFIQGYGLTEHPWASWLSKADHEFDVTQEPPARLASAGRVHPFIEMKLVDDDGNVVADGEPGEIHVRSDGAMQSYWGRPDETAATLLEGGWIATGDVGRMEDGFLYIVDRKKDMIVSGGFNIYPTEIENAIYHVAGVLEAAVIGIPSSQWGETVKAFIVVREGFDIQEKDIEQACLERLANYKRPRSIEFVESLPKTGTGKIARRALRDQYWEGAARRVGGA